MSCVCVCVCASFGILAIPSHHIPAKALPQCHPFHYILLFSCVFIFGSERDFPIDWARDKVLATEICVCV